MAQKHPFRGFQKMFTHLFHTMWMVLFAIYSRCFKNETVKNIVKLSLAHKILHKITFNCQTFSSRIYDHTPNVCLLCHGFCLHFLFGAHNLIVWKWMRYLIVGMFVELFVCYEKRRTHMCQPTTFTKILFSVAVVCISHNPLSTFVYYILPLNK